MCLGLDAKVKSPACLTPPFERLEDRLEQPAGDAAIPELGMDGERAEEAERAPAGREHRANDVAVDLGC